MITLIKNLPLSYNRDLQEDKPPLFESADTTIASLQIAEETFAGLKVNAAKMESECLKGYLLATELADYLARKGMPFRKAHSIVGKLVKDLRSLEGATENLEELSLVELQQYSPLFEKDIHSYLSPRNNAAQKNSYGGTGKQALATQIKNLKKLLK